MGVGGEDYTAQENGLPHMLFLQYAHQLTCSPGAISWLTETRTTQIWRNTYNLYHASLEPCSQRFSVLKEWGRGKLQKVGRKENKLL